MSSNFNPLGNPGLQEGESADSRAYGISLEDGEDMGYIQETLCREEKLWRAVLAQVVKDCVINLSRLSHPDRISENRLVKTTACNFVLEGIPAPNKNKKRQQTDFEKVCELAGFDNPALVRNKILEYVTKPGINYLSHKH